MYENLRISSKVSRYRGMHIPCTDKSSVHLAESAFPKWPVLGLGVEVVTLVI